HHPSASRQSRTAPISSRGDRGLPSPTPPFMSGLPDRSRLTLPQHGHDPRLAAGAVKIYVPCVARSGTFGCDRGGSGGGGGAWNGRIRALAESVRRGREARMGEALDTVKRALDAFDGGDEDAVLALLDENLVVEAPGGVRIEGRD